MHKLAERLRAAFETLAPGLSGHLNPGATAEDIAALETKLGVSLPDDMKGIYLEINGQGDGSPNLLDGTEFLSLARIAEEWTVWNDLLTSGTFADQRCEPSPGVRDDWWNAAWIPVTYNGSGDHHSVDLDPGPGGARGQLIMMWHDDSERPFLASSLSSWLDDLCRQMEAGELVYSAEEYFAVVRASDI